MRFIILLAATLFLVSCKDEPKKTPIASTNPGEIPEPIKVDSSNFTTILWLDSAKDYGKITEGQKLDVSFRFKNTGDKPLIIEGVRPSCGCTVANPPKEPIAPGEEGEIKASFDSNGRSGMQHKTLYVTANTKISQSHDLNFTLEVQKKP